MPTFPFRNKVSRAGRTARPGAGDTRLRVAPASRRVGLLYGPGLAGCLVHRGGAAPPGQSAPHTSEGRLFQARWSVRYQPVVDRSGPTPRAVVPVNHRLVPDGLAREPSPLQVL